MRAVMAEVPADFLQLRRRRGADIWDEMVIDRDSRAVEIYVLCAGGQDRVVQVADGWLYSAATAVQMRSQPDGKLAIQMAGDVATLRFLPEVRPK